MAWLTFRKFLALHAGGPVGLAWLGLSYFKKKSPCYAQRGLLAWLGWLKKEILRAMRGGAVGLARLAYLKKSLLVRGPLEEC